MSGNISNISKYHHSFWVLVTFLVTDSYLIDLPVEVESNLVLDNFFTKMNFLYRTVLILTTVANLFELGL